MCLARSYQPTCFRHNSRPQQLMITVSLSLQTSHHSQDDHTTRYVSPSTSQSRSATLRGRHIHLSTGVKTTFRGGLFQRRKFFCPEIQSPSPTASFMSKFQMMRASITRISTYARLAGRTASVMRSAGVPREISGPVCLLLPDAVPGADAKGPHARQLVVSKPLVAQEALRDELEGHPPA